MADEFNAVQERAREALKNMSEEEKAGMRDFHLLTMSMGIPVVRIILKNLVMMKVAPEAREEIIDRISKLFPQVNDHGCMKVDYFNTTDEAPATTYIMLDECPIDHNFDVQLDRLKCHVAPKKWPEIIQHISVLIQIGRSIYSQITRVESELLRQICGEDYNDYLDLKIDRKNTTLYLNESWLVRIGIFIRDADV